MLRRPAGYLLDVAAEAVDAERFTALAARAETTPDPRERADLLTEALELWRGPAFADFADEAFTAPADPRSPGSAATARSPDSAASPGKAPGLPVPPTELIGRDEAIRHIARLLSTSRLVTLTGVGGVGKTRRALAEFAAVGDRWGVAAATCEPAEPALIRGDIAGLRRDARRALALFAESGDRWGRLRALELLAQADEIGGDYAAAGGHRREGLRLAEELRLPAEASFMLAGLGRVALLTGDLERAEELHERARRLGAEQGVKQAEQHAELGLALIARRRGDLEGAEAHLRAWLEWDRSRDGGAGLALIYAELGFIAEMRGDAAAEDFHRRSLDAARATGDPRAVALALEGLAGVAALTGDRSRAAALLEEAAALRASTGAPLPKAERFDVDRITQALAGRDAP
ncbi:AfsR/SARP family transcriptional regulator [Thermomonospora catenispora]|uniref:AfsR/SARP family transcriptional regulator n=1 Tax=Thermomonospora catenispora TaxID=2493090 RepID=UPI001375E5CB|nr:BTAD domain-containing putative transcriptional regulator [Thermomonospora catenispora]